MELAAEFSVYYSNRHVLTVSVCLCFFIFSCLHKSCSPNRSVVFFSEERKTVFVSSSNHKAQIYFSEKTKTSARNRWVFLNAGADAAPAACDVRATDAAHGCAARLPERATSSQPGATQQNVRIRGDREKQNHSFWVTFCVPRCRLPQTFLRFASFVHFLLISCSLFNYCFVDCVAS